MASRYKDKDGGIVLSFNGQWISWAHTAVAYSKSDRRGIEAVDGLESPRFAQSEADFAFEKLAQLHSSAH